MRIRFIYNAVLVNSLKMENKSIELPKQLLDSIQSVVDSTGLFVDIEDFITQAIVKQISKYK